MRTQKRVYRVLTALASFALSLVMSSSTVSAYQPSDASLSDLMSYADVVFIGTIYKKHKRPVLFFNYGAWARLSINVDRMVCGTYDPNAWRNGRVEVLYPTGLAGTPLFKKGTTYIFFMRTSGQLPTIISTPQWTLRVNDGKVYSRLLTDVDKRVSMKTFLNMIDCTEIHHENQLERDCGFKLGPD